AVRADDIAVFVRLQLGVVMDRLVVGIFPGTTLFVQFLLQGTVAELMVAGTVMWCSTDRTDDNVVPFLKFLFAYRTGDSIIIHTQNQPFVSGRQMDVASCDLRFQYTIPYRKSLSFPGKVHLLFKRFAQNGGQSLQMPTALI